MAEPEVHFAAYDPPPPADRGAGRRRALTLSLAAAVTVAGLGTALYLGTLGYDIRRTHMHEARLAAVLAQDPTVYQVTVGLQEKAPMVAIVETPADLDRVISERGIEKEEEIRTLAKKWVQLRVYDAGDMTYFIFFDATDKMKAFVHTSN